MSNRTFPPFSLTRLLKTTFDPQPGQRVCVLIDLANPRDIEGFKFLQDESLTIQRKAHDVFYLGLKNGVLAELGLTGGDIFAYEMTGGSNLDLSDEAFTPEGKQVSFARDIYPNYDLILCVSTYSATAPLTASAKEHGFRGATLHGVNDIILGSGLSVDYDEVSVEAEKLRQGMTRADWVELDFQVGGQKHTLKLELGGQEAQKSHGLCRGSEPDVANLPAGEIYYVPVGAEGAFPMKYEDGTLGLLTVTGGRVIKSDLIKGSAATIEAHNRKLASDPVTGELGELGFGTQVLPVSGRDIQDEKIRGTFHLATGRSDHLGGSLTPDRFASRLNATHDDILFSREKTPEVTASEVRICRDNRVEVLLKDFHPAPYMESLLK